MTNAAVESAPQAGSGKVADATKKRSASKALNADKRSNLSNADQQGLRIISTARRTLQAAEKELLNGAKLSPEFMQAVGEVVARGGAWLAQS